MSQNIELSISINASNSVVWQYLTDSILMKEWMAEPETQIEILTDWKIGNPLIIKGYHHGKFENKGTVLQFEPEKILRYTHLSSISRLPDKPESYTHFTFELSPVHNQTRLNIKIDNFPTESIYKHLDFYWRSTIKIIKDLIEN